MPRRVIAILEVMWDWENMTSSAGYRERAPSYFRINQDNFTGKRLYYFLGKNGQFYDDLLVTNACPELVSSASGRGKPDADWLRENLAELWPFDLLLVCGRVAQDTYDQKSAPPPCRTIELPHPAARHWTREALDGARRFIQEGKHSLSLEIVNKRLVAERLLPF